MKKLLPLAAALTFTLTACAAPASSAAVPTATEATELQAVGSGEVHILTPHRDGMYYQTSQQCEIDHTDQIGRILVYSIDEMTNTARPACNVPDCPHDSTACPLTRRSRKRIAASPVLGMAGFCRFPSGTWRMTAAALSPVFPPYIIVPMVR